MDVGSVTQIITSVGFPIAACIALFLYMVKLSELHKEEMNKITDALNNNTIALTELKDLLNNKEV